MKIKTVEIKTYMIYSVCTECNTVLTDADQEDTTYMSMPIRKNFICPSCNHKMTLEEPYWPHIEYRED